MRENLIMKFCIPIPEFYLPKKKPFYTCVYVVSFNRFNAPTRKIKIIRCFLPIGDSLLFSLFNQISERNVESVEKSQKEILIRCFTLTTNKYQILWICKEK